MRFCLCLCSKLFIIYCRIYHFCVIFLIEVKQKIVLRPQTCLSEFCVLSYFIIACMWPHRTDRLMEGLGHSFVHHNRPTFNHSKAFKHLYILNSRPIYTVMHVLQADDWITSNFLQAKVNRHNSLPFDWVWAKKTKKHLINNAR